MLHNNTHIVKRRKIQEEESVQVISGNLKIDLRFSFQLIIHLAVAMPLINVYGKKRNQEILICKLCLENQQQEILC